MFMRQTDYSCPSDQRDSREHLPAENSLPRWDDELVDFLNLDYTLSQLMITF